MPAALSMESGGVAAVCDPRAGLGADGVLRVTVAGSAREAGVFDQLPAGVTQDDWYLDRREPDGSVVESRPEGVRLFAHYLWLAGLERRRRFVVGTFCGARLVELHSVDDVDADVTVTADGSDERGTSQLMALGKLADHWWQAQVRTS